MLQKSSELSIKAFYCVFVRTEINLIAFSGPRNCVNTQYAALSGAMDSDHLASHVIHSAYKCLPISASFVYAREECGA